MLSSIYFQDGETEEEGAGCYLWKINRLSDKRQSRGKGHFMCMLGAWLSWSLALLGGKADIQSNKYCVSQVERLSPSWTADAWDSVHCFQSSFAKGKS